MESTNKKTLLETAPWLRLLVPLVVSCCCILNTILLVNVLHFYPQIAWNIHASMWIFVTLLIVLLNDFISDFSAMLITWAFWFSLQSEISMSWRLIDSGLQTPLLFNERLFNITRVLVVLCSPCFITAAYSSLKHLVVRSVFVLAVIVLVPKPRLASESLLLGQTIAFFVLYWTQHFIADACYERTTPLNLSLRDDVKVLDSARSVESQMQIRTTSSVKHRTALLAASKLLGSVWAFWIQDFKVLFSLCLVSFLFNSMFLLWNANYLTFDREMYKLVFIKAESKSE